MNYVTLSRVIGSVLLLVVGMFIGLGSKALWHGRPSNWPDLTATDPVVITASRWGVALAIGFAVCAVSSFLSARWAFAATTVFLAVALVILFWGHYVLFGTWDPIRATINVAVAAVILLLLRKGTQ